MSTSDYTEYYVKKGEKKQIKCPANISLDHVLHLIRQGVDQQMKIAISEFSFRYQGVPLV